MFTKLISRVSTLLAKVQPKGTLILIKFRSQTIKARANNQNYPVIGGRTYIKSDLPSGISQIRQSLDFPIGNEPEDFIVNDTDEKVTSHK